MTRAEQRALEAYPRDDNKELNFRRANYRIAYERGYEQAEKDLTLTPADIKLITKIHYEIVFKDTTGIKVGDVASEVLKRFKEAKEIAINEAKNVKYSCESGYDYEALENLEMGEMNIIRKKK